MSFLGPINKVTDCPIIRNQSVREFQVLQDGCVDAEDSWTAPLNAPTLEI